MPAPPPPRSWVLPEPALSRAAGSPHRPAPGCHPSARNPPLICCLTGPSPFPQGGVTTPAPVGSEQGAGGAVGADDS